MAFHYVDFHNTLKKLCFATEYGISNEKKCYEDSKSENQTIDIQLYYPIFVTQNDIYEVYTKGDITLKNVNHIKYLRTEYVSGKFISNRIDVVTEDYFPKLLAIVEDEFQKTTQLIKEKSDKLKKELI